MATITAEGHTDASLLSNQFAQRLVDTRLLRGAERRVVVETTDRPVITPGHIGSDASFDTGQDIHRILVRKHAKTASNLGSLRNDVPGGTRFDTHHAEHGIGNIMEEGTGCRGLVPELAGHGLQHRQHTPE